MNKILVTLFASIILLTAGCKTAFGNKLGNLLYDPVTSTNIVDTADGKVSVVTTNGWVIDPKISASIGLAGDVAPFPWAGLAANGLLGLLAVGSHVMGRKYKKALVTTVQTYDELRSEVRKLGSQGVAIDKEHKGKIISVQAASGVLDVISAIVKKHTSKTT